MLWSTARHKVWLPERICETGDLETLRWIGGLECFSMPWSFETSLYLPCFFKISFSLPLFLLHKAKDKGQQRAMAQFLQEAGWIKWRNEKALCLVHPFHKQLKIKSHISLVFNSQSWNDRFPSGLVCLLVHRPQCLEVMLQTDLALRLMHISHSCFFTAERWKIRIWNEECLVFQVTLPCREFLVCILTNSRADCYYWRLLRQLSVCGCAPAC